MSQSHPVKRPDDRRLSEVSLEPFQALYRLRPTSTAALARTAGIDERHVARMVGAIPGLTKRRKDGSRGSYTPQTTSYNHALRLAEAMGADPVDMGL